MGNPYVGEIRIFAGSFAPLGWLFCDGTTLPISQYDVLFNLIGTTYGGDGQSTFSLPDLRGRLPMHVGTGNPLGMMAGAENVTLTTNQIPSHNHLLNVSPTASSTTPGASLFLSNETVVGATVYAYAPYDAATQVAFSNKALASTGGNQAHNNLQPLVALNFIISPFGIYPTQS